MLRLLHRQPGKALELCQSIVLRHLELVLQGLGVHLAVAEALLAPDELFELGVDLAFLLERALLDLHDLEASILNLRLDLAAEMDCLFTRLDLRLASRRLRLSLGVLEETLAGRLRGPNPRMREGKEQRSSHYGSDDDSDERRDDREHEASVEESLVRGDPAVCSHPARSLPGWVHESHDERQLRTCRNLRSPPRPKKACREPVVESWKFGITGNESLKRAGRMSSESEVILSPRRSTPQRRTRSPPPRTPFPGDSARSSARLPSSRRSRSLARARARAIRARARRDRRQRRLVGARVGSRRRRLLSPRGTPRARPRSASRRARPVRPSVSSASASSTSVNPFARSLPSISDVLRSRRASARSATSTAVCCSATTSQASTGANSGSSAAGTSAARVPSGRSRAEMTWSSSASSWMRARICWTRSGFSRRKFVAFCRP